jgi:signal transduction histidine kinase
MNPSILRARVRLLYSETRWLMYLRWVAGVTIAALGVVNWWFQDHSTHGLLGIAVGFCIVAYNAGLWLTLRAVPRLESSYDLLLNFATLQICLDLACLVMLAVWTGGLASPVLFAFLAHMLFASLLQPLERTLVIAIAVIAGLGVGLWATQQWPTTARELITALGWVSTMLLTVYLTNRITSALYLREEARVHQLERNEEMWTKLVAQQATLVQAEKMAAMGQMAAGIAHEITNPLASMDSVLQLMQRNPAAPRPAAVTTLRQQIERILQIMRQFTAFSHPGRGVVESVKVGDVIRSSLDMLMFNRSMKRVEMVCRFEETDATVRINPHALQQVLANIVINAMDAVANVTAPRITVTTAQTTEACVIEISDNGTGIAPEHLPRIFESFFTTKPVGKGTGLGLAICARLVREQGGRLEVRSTLGLGTTFTITLVAAPLDQPGVAGPLSDGVVPGAAAGSIAAVGALGAAVALALSAGVAS